MDQWNRRVTLGANIGVLIGILFLAYEVNLSRKAAIADIYQNRAFSRSEADLQIAISSQNFVQADVKFQRLREEYSIAEAIAQLTEEERYVVRRWHASLMIRFDNVAFQYSLGLIPEAYWQSIVRGIQGFLPIWEEFNVVLPDTSRQMFEQAIIESNK